MTKKFVTFSKLNPIITNGQLVDPTPENRKKDSGFEQPPAMPRKEETELKVRVAYTGSEPAFKVGGNFFL
jgi:hypothetical protein